MSNSKQAGSKQARAAARLAAVQALYQFDMEGTLLPTLLDEFHRHRLGMTIDEEEYAKAEVAFFDDVVKGVISRRDEIDELLSGKLAEGWALPASTRPCCRFCAREPTSFSPAPTCRPALPSASISTWLTPSSMRAKPSS